MNGYFSRIELRDDAAARRELARRLPDGYGLHQAVWRLFQEPDITGRDFLYRPLDEAEPLAFYAVSARPPRRDDKLWRVHTKEYAPRIASGERLAFSLRANPVVTRHADSADSRSARHDVVMDASKHGISDPSDPAGPYHAAGLRWLQPRAARHGFQVERMAADGYRQQRLFKPGRTAAVGTRPIQFNTLDFNGVLTVTDAAAFNRALFTGIGPAKGFGCGLLLVRRVP